MRGKAIICVADDRENGITPAHAGKSPFRWYNQRVIWDHPRACGEKMIAEFDAWQEQGSPPRMRGKAALLRPVIHGVGITPAHAGKSLPSRHQT